MIVATFGPPELLMVATILVFLVVLVFLAVAETSINRISKPKALALMEEPQNRKAARALLHLVSEPEAFMNPVLVTINIAQTGQAFLTSLLVSRISGSWVAAVAAFALNIVVFFVLAESLPKTWAVLSTERAALLMARPTQALVRFSPLRLLSRGLIGLTNVIFPGRGLKQGPFVSEREFLGIVDAAVEDEVIEHEERELIESVIEFGDTVAREIMLPRPDMKTIAATATVSEALDLAIEHGLSRLPVSGDDLDDVVGVAYAKDLMRAEREGDGQTLVGALARPAHFVPDTKAVADLMREMQAEKFHMAIVVDEYGGIAGLVTLEDCIEELIGDIVDEYDVEPPQVEHLPAGELRLNAAISVGELNDILELHLPDDDWDTVGGFVLGSLGHVPEAAEFVEECGYRFTIEKMDGRRVATVRVSPIPGWEPPLDDDDD
jgi:putative hemolysin